MAQLLSHDEQTYQFEIAQFYCEIAQAALFKSNLDAARYNIGKALEANKNVRAPTSFSATSNTVRATSLPPWKRIPPSSSKTTPI